MKVKRKIIEIDEELCDGCGQCAIACAEGAINIVNGKAKVISDNLCDGLGACIGDCPTDALKIIEREAYEFDEKAVEKHLAKRKESEGKTLPCGCPSTQIKEFAPLTLCQEANKSVLMDSTDSALTHWPVHLRVIPSTAPFLKGADLLVTADCVPVAFPTFHSDFLKGRVVMIGCPKFDNRERYVEKFTEILKTADIKSITCVVMTVPCCSGFPAIITEALKLSKKEILLEKVVINNRGKIVKT
mmetsp:Transcript_616/g.447  ORF Transcript_616/g.447 Transcript_616/m.447 type:complete len:244 (+) Transcript_616:687-1418(+)